MNAPTQQENRAYARNVSKSFLYGFLMDCSLTAPIWVLYLRDERGFSLTQITFLEVPLFLLIVFAEVPTGAVADRFGRKVSLMLASAILSVSMFVYGIATEYVVVLISNLTWGLAFTFRSGADTALLYDSLKQVGREADFQKLNGRFWALRSAAMLAGYLLGAPIAAATSYSFAIMVSAALAACAVPVALSMHEPRHALAQAREPYLRTLTSGIREAWRRSTLRYIFFYSGFVIAGAVAPLLLFQQPWLAAHGVSTGELGLWQAPVQATEIFAALAAGWLLTRVGERGMFAAMPLALFACGMALAAIDHLWIAVAFVGMATVRGLLNQVLAVYVNERIESARRATILSVQNLATNLVMACAWPFGGAVADALGLRAAFLAFAAAALLFGGGTLLLWDGAERADVAASEADGIA